MALTIQQIQDFITNNGDARQAINMLADYVQANPGGGGGDVGGALLTETVVLTDAQIKNLPTDGVELIPAPGANKYITIVAASAYIDSQAEAYTDVDGAGWSLSYDSEYFATSPLVVGLPGAMLSGGEPNIAHFIPALTPIFSQSDFGEFTVSESNGSVSGIINKGLRIEDKFNGLSNYGGGNAANKAIITINYVIDDLTGLI